MATRYMSVEAFTKLVRQMIREELQREITQSFNPIQKSVTEEDLAYKIAKLVDAGHSGESAAIKAITEPEYEDVARRMLENEKLDQLVSMALSYNDNDVVLQPSPRRVKQAVDALKEML